MGDGEKSSELLQKIKGVGMEGVQSTDGELIKDNNFIILTEERQLEELKEALNHHMIYGDCLLTTFPLELSKLELPKYIDVVGFYKNHDDQHWKVKVYQNYTSYGLQLGLAFSWATAAADLGVEEEE